MSEELRMNFQNPSDEFTPIPFWFWNDELSEKEITRQIEDFCEKGVMGFVIHPRYGMPESIPYLSDIYMHYVKHAVEEAHKRGMRVVLYDEAMYPSGSAHGLLVKENPAYATRALRMEEGVQTPTLEEGEEILAVVDDIFLIESYSHGTIRGVHIGEDDLEEHAPASGDLLNPEAMSAFIRITYERYYEVLEPYFGNTILAMFTDEPAVLGRCARKNVKPWTVGFDRYWMKEGGTIEELVLLWKEAADGSHEDVRRRFQKAVNKRLSESYYSQISKWCEEHHIALTGHPAKGEDIGVLKHFQIPGQDVVWRYIAPGESSSIEGAESTLGKCSSDAARHSGRRRNANEAFGCCGPKEYLWGFTADEMKWYMDWLFVRGVNLLYPHAFFYSVNGEERYGERPPGVGPNNTFWPHYRQISDYMKRMCWLMTDSYNTTPIAILCEEEHLPWEPAKELYCNQVEFNYLEEALLTDGICKVEQGTLAIEKQIYRVILADSRTLSHKPEVATLLDTFAKQGGTVIYWDKEDVLDTIPSDCKEIKLAALDGTKDIRISHVVKDGKDFFLLVNEGENDFVGIAEIPLSVLQGDGVDYHMEQWNAWESTMKEQSATKRKDTIAFSVELPRRESRMYYIEEKDVTDLSSLFSLGDWCEKEEYENYSGTLTYETTISCEKPGRKMVLDLGEVHEIATVSINGTEIGTRMWAPYCFDISKAIREGDNTIQITVANTPANRFEKAKLVSGLLGPVKLIGLS